ncbi:hypothetical protein QA599_21175 [Haloarculaceae archaeon H-GB1-1]|nr:hypothetical protein [Haloarculaceae archaeon H-GB1-1]
MSRQSKRSQNPHTYPPAEDDHWLPRLLELSEETATLDYRNLTTFLTDFNLYPKCLRQVLSPEQA